MPTFRGTGGTPVVQFDPVLEISPFALFRRLQAGSAPRLLDIRPALAESTATLSLAGAERPPKPDWRPAEPDEEIVLFDDHGNRAVELARQLQEAGFTRVKALFGGLDLYEFSLDPEIVGRETFLVRL
ncbi:MAG: rhodanese-like domain-containing protein [Acidobacteria bacterium]|nr:rhodanese-like domain-containing protein [Acidobacteriota bacterium]